MHKNNLFSSCIFQVGTSLSPLTVNRGRGQRGGRVPSWQENCYFATAPRVTPSPFSMLQQIQIAAPCPVSSETGFFLQPAGGNEVLDGALDGCFGQTRVAGNGWNGREASTVLVATLAEVEVCKSNCVSLNNLGCNHWSVKYQIIL